MLSSDTAGGGVLYLVVGASGVGKDTLLASAREALSATHHFARRVITRSADAGGEDHQAVGATQFAEMVAAGAFALSWSAHGLRYGILRNDTDRLADGMHVVANVSRSAIEHARAQFSRLRIVHVTACEDVLRKRLQARGRESLSDIESRLARAGADAPHGHDVVTVRNDGSLDEALRQFIEALGMCHAADRPSARLQRGRESATSEATRSGFSKNRTPT